MLKYFIAMLIVPSLLLGWLIMQHIGRHFAKAHPELGRYREEGGGCGKNCGCRGKCAAAKDS